MFKTDKSVFSFSFTIFLFLHLWFPNAVVSQEYVTHVNPEYVILGNSIVVKCEVPSFVADFVRVTGWLEETGGSTFHLQENAGAAIYHNFTGYIFGIFLPHNLGIWLACEQSYIVISIVRYEYIYIYGRTE